MAMRVQIKLYDKLLTSKDPPDLACITIFNNASAEILINLKK